MERGETDVLHFLFAKNEALIGRGIVRLRDISSAHRGSRCTTEQRKTQSGRTQHRQGGGLGCAFLPRSLLDASHGRILCCCERACRGKFALGERGAQDLPPCHKMKWNLGERAEPKRLGRAAARPLKPNWAIRLWIKLRIVALEGFFALWLHRSREIPR
jgi:hypothetical protein